MAQRHQLFYQPHSYPSLMEFIRDKGYEDWGDCRGRAWCATCHIKISNSENLLAVDEEEQVRLNQLSNLIWSSRLACQIPLDEKVHALEISFLGDD